MMDICLRLSVQSAAVRFWFLPDGLNPDPELE